MNAQDGSCVEESLLEEAKFQVLSPCDQTAEAKAARAELLRTALPACQPQEGSPANTFTDTELQQLQEALHIGPSKKEEEAAKAASKNVLDICGTWEAPEPLSAKPPPVVDWHGAPSFAPNASVAQEFRQRVREGLFRGPTNGVCPGFLQCNMVVLPQGKEAFDFLLFCQRNPKACPLLEVCDEGSPVPVGLAPGADLRTDVPKYAIYRNGKLEQEVHDATAFWPEKSVAFLIGCSFSYDGALLDAGVPLRSAEQGKNVPMYRTNLKCRPAGSLKGNMVVSMKPIPALQVSKHVEVTSKFQHAHGGPVCIGRSEVIGISNLQEPDWGDAVDMRPDEVPVFHACGVTPQSVLMDSKIPFAITHSAGYMFVTDMPSDMGGGL